MQAKALRALKGADLILQVYLWNLSTISWQKRFIMETKVRTTDGI